MALPRCQPRHSWFVNSTEHYGLTLALVAGSAGDDDLYTAVPAFILTYWVLGVSGPCTVRIMRPQVLLLLNLEA